jgi:endogenous inhibitor of DNA gyrase (YacG/DUF329 family)
MTEPKPHRGKCPICDRAADAKYRPFCSRRCADVDRARWLSGAYAIPDTESEDGDEGSEGVVRSTGPDNGSPGTTH